MAPEARMGKKKGASSAPDWYLLGSVWLVSGLLGLILLIGLICLLLYDRPALLYTAGVMGTTIVLLLNWLGLREDRDLFKRLSSFFANKRAAQRIIILFVIIVFVVWALFGVPKCLSIIDGSRVRCFAIDVWKNLTPGASAYEGMWTEETRRRLYAKFSLIDVLAGIAWKSPQVTDQVRRDLDLWVEGDFKKTGDVVRLSAYIAGRGGKYIGSVSVQRAVDEQDPGVEARILAMQNELAQEILRKLGIKTDAELLAQMQRTPTDNPQALCLNNEGVALFLKGDLTQAAEYFQDAILLDPAYASAHNNLGQVYTELREYNVAIMAFKEAINHLPRNPIYYFNLGLAHDFKGAYRAAADAYQRAIDIDGSYAKAYNNLGFVLRELAEWDRARQTLQRGLDLTSDNHLESVLHKNLGRVALEQGQVDEAIQEFQQALERFDPYAEALFYLAVAHEQAGNREAACQTWARYNEVSNDDEATRQAEAQRRQDDLSCKEMNQ